MSTRSTIWFGTDERGRDCHLYWELAERVPHKTAPIYMNIEAEGKEMTIRLPKEIAHPTTPSKKRVQRICKAISEMTRRNQTQQDATRLVEALNRKINGWANYFCLGPVSQAYRAVEQHTCRRLRQWLCVKHKERARGNTRFPQKALHQKFGLVRLTARTASFPWATA